MLRFIGMQEIWASLCPSKESDCCASVDSWSNCCKVRFVKVVSIVDTGNLLCSNYTVFLRETLISFWINWRLVSSYYLWLLSSKSSTLSATTDEARTGLRMRRCSIAHSLIPSSRNYFAYLKLGVNPPSSLTLCSSFKSDMESASFQTYYLSWLNVVID